MKTSTKILLLASAGLISLGLILSAVGLACGGSLSSIAKQKLWMFHSDTPLMHYDNEYHESNTYKVKNTSIDAIEIDWIGGNITVTPYDGEDILLKESGNIRAEKDCLRYHIKNGCLSIDYCKTQFHIGIDLFTDEDLPVKDLEIQIPKRLAQHLTSFSCDAVSSNIRLNDIGVSEVSSETVSGSLSGTLSGVDAFDFATVSGDVDVKLSACPSTLDFSSVSGCCKLYLPKKSNVTVSFDTISGDFKSDFKTCCEDDDEYIIGSGKADFSIDTTSGDMILKKLKK